MSRGKQASPKVIKDRFSLGIPGERWDQRLCYISIEVPSTGEYVLVQKGKSERGEYYHVVSSAGRVVVTYELISAIAAAWVMIEEIKKGQLHENLQD